MSVDHLPQLPAAYELVSVGEVESLREVVAELAQKGAAEGTILLAENQTRTLGCAGKPWQGFKGNLHASIILQPDFDPALDNEMLFVGITSLGNAIAAHVSPMTALAYSWPNDINIAGNKVASIWLDRGNIESARWLAITCSVNIKKGPGGFTLPAISILEAEGSTDLTANTLLESWARQFVRMINLWSDKGFGHIFSLWQVRSEIVGKQMKLQLDGATIEGVAKEVTSSGDIVVKLSNGGQTTVSSRAYMNW